MTSYDPFSLALPVTEAERDRAEHLLKEAYVDGRLDMAELDRRVGQVMVAATRRDLNACVAGLPPAPRPAPAPFSAPLPAKAGPAGTGAAAAAHFLPFVSWIFGPLAIWALSAPRSYARREAAKAFNFQLTSTVLLITLSIVGGILDIGLLDTLVGLAWVGWVVLTIVGGAKAAQGANWINPVNRVVRWNVLDPSGR